MSSIPGTLISEAALYERGFRPLRLAFEWDPIEVPPYGAGCLWSTVDPVPEGPGLYAFTVEEENRIHVAYVGRTENLWMVTKGRLPNGQSRPAQRYGRPRYAGDTRKRINAHVAQQLREGRAVRHWVRPQVPRDRDPALLAQELVRAEEEAISGWRLRFNGWNRG